MIFGCYCLEGVADCAVMLASSAIVILNTIYLLLSMLKGIKNRRSSSVRSSIKQIRGAERKMCYCFKIFGTVFLLFISVAQLLVWVIINNSQQSIILIQMFAVNIISCAIWIFALILDKKYKGYTQPLTLINMLINLICNICVALLGSRNSLDNQDDAAFYLYLGFIAVSGIYQVYMKVYQRDFEQISLDDIDSKKSSTFSIENQRKTTSNNTAGEPTGIDGNQSSLQDKLLSEEENYEQVKIGKANSKSGNSENIKKGKSNNDANKQKNKIQNPEQYDEKNHVKSQNQQSNEDAIIKYAEGNCIEEEETKICKYRIENIRIEKFLETIKYSKKTIIYEIKCTYKGKIYSVKRSFREFGALNSQMKQKYKDQRLPPFPQKKAQNSILTYNDLEERKKQLSQYLQSLNQVCEPEELIVFMTQTDQQPTSPTQYHQQQQMRNGQKKSSFGEEHNQTFNSSQSNNYNVPEIIWEEEEELNVSVCSKD
ncbi:PX domain protein (macronuclear) [Tetrahymena thermophila SB210]|uniref:PX domain protein n=1 Tax=Tetrahymena thermophila (strain SB210) TaxID=312017 RepID=Q22KA6_TETTS|nr:PX domain protein [Tetrahymena thermophila SB210]EAR85893.2 PX domain protein [Tetrahymena thermophila SB210]|eukprot:XP_001033556.2 PX domain protein [Tetrahymena thermophila SB210]